MKIIGMYQITYVHVGELDMGWTELPGSRGIVSQEPRNDNTLCFPGLWALRVDGKADGALELSETCHHYLRLVLSRGYDNRVHK